MYRIKVPNELKEAHQNLIEYFTSSCRATNVWGNKGKCKCTNECEGRKMPYFKEAILRGMQARKPRTQEVEVTYFQKGRSK